MVNVMISRLVLNLRSCQGESMLAYAPSSGRGPSAIQVHISVDEVELEGPAWKSKPGIPEDQDHTEADRKEARAYGLEV